MKYSIIVSLYLVTSAIRRTKGDEENVLVTTMSVVEKSSFPAPISLTAETFVDLIENSNVFVDKTMLIKEVFKPDNLDYGDFDILRVFARPRGWGKTVMLDMIKMFCEMPMDEKRRTVLPLNQSIGYKLFRHGVLEDSKGGMRKLQQPLLVSKDNFTMDKYQGRHPVVCFDFKGIKAKDFADFRKQIAERFRRGFEMYDFDYMSKHTINTTFEPTLLDRLALDKLVEKVSDEDYDVEYVAEVSLMLKEYFKAYPVILVDNYDEPLLNLITSPVPHKATMMFNATLFYFHIFRKFHQVKFYTRALFAGSIRIWQDIPITRKDAYHEMREGICIHHSHGFKQHEVDLIFDYVNLTKEFREKAARYYGGYQMAHGEGITYNPSSIAKFLASGEFKIYWQSNEAIDKILDEFLTVQKFRHYLKNKISTTVKTVKRRLLNESMVSRHFIKDHDIVRLSVFFEDTESGVAGYYDGDLHDNAIYLMRCAGYFTHFYEIPNEEVREKLSTILEDAIIPY